MLTRTSRWIAPLTGVLLGATAAGAVVAVERFGLRHPASPGVANGAETTPVQDPRDGSRTDFVTLAAGTRAPVRMESRISSESAHSGDVFQAALLTPVLEGGRVVLPAGTRVTGRVAEASPTGRGKHKAKLVLEFASLDLADGEKVDIEARPLYFEAGGKTKRDVELIGGGTLLGGIVGKLTGNTGRGALIGAAAGTGAALETKGDAVVVPPGHRLNLVLQHDVRVPVKETRA